MPFDPSLSPDFGINTSAQTPWTVPTKPSAGTPWPDIQQVQMSDLVGPVAANRQEAALWRRDETLAAAVNALLQNNDQLVNAFLLLDGSNSPTADVSWGGHSITDLASQTVGPSAPANNTAATAGYVAAYVANANALLTGTYSITFVGVSPNQQLALVNDAVNPGSSYYYGTNSAGTKGWYATSTIAPNVSTQVRYITTSQTITVNQARNVRLIVVGGGGGGAGGGGSADYGGGGGGGGGIVDGLAYLATGTYAVTIGGGGGGGGFGGNGGDGGASSVAGVAGSTASGGGHGVTSFLGTPDGGTGGYRYSVGFGPAQENMAAFGGRGRYSDGEAAAGQGQNHGNTQVLAGGFPAMGGGGAGGWITYDGAPAAANGGGFFGGSGGLGYGAGGGGGDVNNVGGAGVQGVVIIIWDGVSTDITST